MAQYSMTKTSKTPDERLPGADNVRVRLLSAMPVTERRLDLAGIQTSVLEGGVGPPIVLLHGPGEHAAKWISIFPTLLRHCRVIAPDLPGHGNTLVTDGPIDVDHVFEWLDALIMQTSPVPPTLVGHAIGGAIAARFASRNRGRLSRLVLVDTLGLSAFQPAPEFGQALTNFLSTPDEKTHDDLWRYCVFDFDGLRQRLGKNWDWIKAYNLDRAHDAALRTTQKSLIEQFGMPAISEEQLGNISVPTVLIWGRHDLATPLSVAEAASKHYHWPLHVIERAADDPPIEQPEAFLTVLCAVLGTTPEPSDGANQ